MSFVVPDQFPVEKEDVVLTFDNQTYIQFHRKKECYKRPVELKQHLVMVILKGAKVMISTEQTITVGKYELLFLEKGAYLTSEKILEEGEFSSLLFFIPADFLAQFKTKHAAHLSKATGPANSDKMFKVPQSNHLEGYINSLLPYFESSQQIAQPLLQLKIEELLLSLLFADPKKQFSHYLAHLGQRTTAPFREIVEQSIYQNLTIAERAFLCNLSESSFKRKFKEIFHDSPAHWLRMERLKRARMLIQTTDKSVGEIAFEVGFESTSHFIHIFKKQYGSTPKQMSA
ncbi:MAG: AraC family transcriptional regulator [Bacteroidota bacterium]